MKQRLERREHSLSQPSNPRPGTIARNFCESGKSSRLIGRIVSPACTHQEQCIPRTPNEPRYEKETLHNAKVGPDKRPKARRAYKWYEIDCDGKQNHEVHDD